MPIVKDDSQDIVVKNAVGDVTATNIKADKLEVNITNNFLIETTEYKSEKDDALWNNEETVISLQDQEMIAKVIQDVNELKEVLPEIKPYYQLLKMLPLNHQGLFLSAIQLIYREDKISKKISKNPQTLDEEAVELLNKMNEEEDFKRIYDSEYTEDFRKIYNLLRSKDIERKVIPPMLELREVYGSIEIIQQQFFTYWVKRLNYHPYAVFLCLNLKGSRKLDIAGQVISKLDNNEKENVRIYAKENARILIARTICEEIKKSYGLNYQEEDYYIGDKPAAEFIIDKRI